MTCFWYKSLWNTDRPYFRSLYIGYLGSARRSLNLSATLKMVLAEKKYLPFITYYLSHIHIVCFTICTMFDLKVVCNLNTTWVQNCQMNVYMWRHRFFLLLSSKFEGSHCAVCSLKFVFCLHYLLFPLTLSLTFDLPYPNKRRPKIFQ